MRHFGWLVFALVGGCAVSSSSSSETSSTTQEIIGGSASSTDNAVVLLASYPSDMATCSDNVHGRASSRRRCC